MEFRIEDIKTSFISVFYLRYTNVMTLKLCTLTKLHCYPFYIKTFCFSRTFHNVYQAPPSPPHQGVLEYKNCFWINDFICFAWFETLDSPVLKITKACSSVFVSFFQYTDSVKLGKWGPQNSILSLRTFFWKGMFNLHNNWKLQLLQHCNFHMFACKQHLHVNIWKLQCSFQYIMFKQQATKLKDKDKT